MGCHGRIRSEIGQKAIKKGGREVTRARLETACDGQKATKECEDGHMDDGAKEVNSVQLESPRERLKRRCEDEGCGAACSKGAEEGRRRREKKAARKGQPDRSCVGRDGAEAGEG